MTACPNCGAEKAADEFSCRGCWKLLSRSVRTRIGHTVALFATPSVLEAAHSDWATAPGKRQRRVAHT